MKVNQAETFELDVTPMKHGGLISDIFFTAQSGSGAVILKPEDCKRILEIIKGINSQECQ